MRIFRARTDGDNNFKFREVVGNKRVQRRVSEVRCIDELKVLTPLTWDEDKKEALENYLPKTKVIFIGRL